MSCSSLRQMKSVITIKWSSLFRTPLLVAGNFLGGDKGGNYDMGGYLSMSAD